MLGKLLVVAIGLAAWKYRNSLTEYVKGNAGPAREKVDGMLMTAQQRSETLLGRAKDQISSAKDQISSRLESSREKLRPGAWQADRGTPTQ
jgi:hypothetical protein